MPTENRSSNTKMVSVPAAHDLASKIREALDREACPNAWMLIAYEAVVKNFPVPAPQPHAEPIAWMVGTAFWWTKEEAERDAAAMGLPVVPLGPMAGPGNPSAWLNTATGAVTTSAVQVMDWDDDGEPVQSLYTHADPGEVERLSQIIRDLNEERDEIGADAGRLRAQLAERDALLNHMAYYLSPALASHQYSMSEETMHHALSVLHEWRQLRSNAEPSDECAHSYANKLGCPECGEKFASAALERQ